MDFYFINATSIRNVTAVLLILDAKTRKLWQFPTQQKRPPLDIVNFFLSQLKRMGREVQHIWTDCDGELAGSSELCALIKNNSEFKSTPVIMLSSKDGLFDKAKGRIVGSDQYLTKPFSKTELLGAIETYAK